MQRKIDIFLLACVSMLLGSCDKFSNGDIVEKEYVLNEPFQVVEMWDNVNVTLKHCDDSHQPGLIHIETGENLIDRITTEIEEASDEDGTIKLNKLVIRNENTLDFLRPYDYTLEMTVYYDTIFSLIFNSNATITTDTLRGYNYPSSFINNDSIEYDSLVPNLFLEVNDGSGDFTVLLNCCKLRTKFNNGTSTINLKGYSLGTFFIGDYNCHGIIDGKDLESNWTTVSYSGTNTVYVKTFDELHIYNYNIGRVFYKRYSKQKKKIHYSHIGPDGHWIPADTIDTVYYCPLKLETIGDNIMPYSD